MKTMKLYISPAQRVANELAARGKGDAEALDAATVAGFDSLHYGGNAVVDECAAALQLSATSRVLDVGSGLGGPARHLASTVGCSVVALELQPDYSACAAALTERCGLAGKVAHVAGNILDPPPAAGEGHDAVVSWLCFLHVPDKAALLAACAAKLAPGGALFVEDFYEKQPFTPDEDVVLARDVASSELPTKEAYEAALRTAGFGQIEWTDMTDTWTKFVADRAAAYRAACADVVKVHGEEIYEQQLAFFNAMDGLFAGGHLGGVRYLARKA